jgi:protein-tyrosine phosphatase
MRVLFVCLGNICRSPIAEVVLRDLAKRKGLAWTVDSAGTNQWHKGGPADPRSVSVCAGAGIDLSGHIARRFRVDDFEAYDRIYSLATDVTEEIRAFSTSAAQMAKVRNFMDVLPGAPGRSVPDPWYGGESDFRECYALIERGCAAIVAEF